jgi:hypothetical protein
VSAWHSLWQNPLVSQKPKAQSLFSSQRPGRSPTHEGTVPNATALSTDAKSQPCQRRRGTWRGSIDEGLIFETIGNRMPA